MTKDIEAMRALRSQVVIMSLTFGAAVVLFFAGIAALHGSIDLLVGLPIAAVILAYELSLLYRNLSLNNRHAEAELLTTLGAGTWLTMLRGLFLALLAGFCVIPRPDGWLAWAPGGLYILAAIADYADGFAARVANHSTPLGQRLDLDFDALGILIAPGVAVLYRQLPIWYLAVSAARYLFIVGTWVLERQGKTVYTLPHSYARRFLAGFQMGLIAVVLLPIFMPPLTYIVATLFMIPFLIGFTRDWLIMSGFLNPESPRYAARQSQVERLVSRQLPLILRPLLVILWLLTLGFGSQVAPSPEAFILQVTAVVSIAAGFIGRLAALILVISIAWASKTTPPNALTTALVITATLLALTGSGDYAAWSPDEVFLRAHAGRARVKNS